MGAAAAVVTVLAEQGHAQGRPSIVRTEVTLRGPREVAHMRVGGVATKTMGGSLYVPRGSPNPASGPSVSQTVSEPVASPLAAPGARGADARASSVRVGVLVPFTNTNLEADLELMRPPGLRFHYHRLGGYVTL